MQTSQDVIVIGGGPAGSAAATFSARCKWHTEVIDRGVDIGFLGSLSNVSYFPGFPESISGKDLLNRIRRQAELVGVHFLTDAVKTVTQNESGFVVATDGGREFFSKVIVVSSGAAYRTNYLHGEKEFLGRGVSYDAIADGPSVAKRPAAVVGKTRQAADAAMIISRFADKVHFIVPSSRLDADDTIVTQLQRNKSIILYYSASLKKINGGDHVSSITVFTGGQEKEIPVSGVFSFVHEYQPSTGFVEKVVELAPNMSIKVDNTFATSVPGIFACGDVLCGRPQLPAIASAQGLLTGIGVDKYLSSKTT